MSTSDWDALSGRSVSGLSAGGMDLPSSDAEVPVDLQVRYEREALLGSGGMGRVYLAQDALLGRAVALKEAGGGTGSVDALAREARLTAGLEHPGIVTVHDAGKTQDGRTFYTMRLVRGRALSEILRENPDVHERIRLLRHFLAACHAVAYAHSLGVIHRDLKPSNLMVGAFGETQVVDWGLACRVGDEPGPPGLGTPSYLSPEAADGAAPSPRADVWGLGAVLYELLCGQAPWGRGPEEEVLRRVRSSSPPSVLARAPWIAPDLAAIAERALSRDPQARYADAGALAEDVEAWLDGRPVGAYRYSRVELLQRAARAWRVPMLVAGVALAVLIALTALGVRSLAQERSSAVASAEVAQDALHSADLRLSSALASQAIVAAKDGARPLAQVLASEALRLGESPEARGVLASAFEQPSPTLQYTWTLPPCRFVRLVGPRDQVCATEDEVVRIADGRTLWRVPMVAIELKRSEHEVLARGPHHSTLIDLKTGYRSAELECCWNSTVLSDRVILEPLQSSIHPPILFDRAWVRDWAPCGEGRITLVSGLVPGTDEVMRVCEDGELVRGEVREPPAWRSRRRFAELLGELHPVLLVVNEAADAVVVGGTGGRLTRVNLKTLAVVEQIPTQSDLPLIMRYSPRGDFLAVLGERGDVHLYCGYSLTPVGELPLRDVRDIRFTEDGALLALTQDEGSAWELSSRRDTSTLRSPTGVTGVAFSSDGALLASSHGAGHVRLWDADTGEVLHQVQLGPGTVKSITFEVNQRSALAAYVVEAGSRPPAGIYRVAPGRPAEYLRDGSARRVVQLRGGRTLMANWGIRLLLTDPAITGQSAAEGCPEQQYKNVAGSPGGDFAALIGLDGGVFPFSAHDLRCLPPIAGRDASSADISADGQALVLGLPSAVAVVDLDGNERWRTYHPPPAPLDVALSPDGRWVAAGGADHNARVWDARTGVLRAVLPGHEERVSSVEFSPDSLRLASGSWDGSLRVWSLEALDAEPEALLEDARVRWNLDPAGALQQLAR